MLFNENTRHKNKKWYLFNTVYKKTMYSLCKEN